MARNEQTSDRVASLAALILSGGKYTKEDVLEIAASALTQARDKPNAK